MSEEPDSEEGAVVPAIQKGRRSLSKVRRELSEEELKSAAVQRMLIDEIERLERENIDLCDYRDKYYESDKRASTLEEKDKERISTQVLFGVCLTVGAALLGYAPSLWQSQPGGWLSIVFGGVLIAGGIASKVVKR
jgi:hypothetical protein